jgi:voltage-gated potassium channel
VTSFYDLVDLLAVVPFYFELALATPADFDTVLGIVRFLKLARYSPALETLGAVVSREIKPLLSATFILSLLMLGSSTVLYLVERSVNSNFTSVPSTMWWSVATLTTVGYGDAVPITPLGKVLGGVVALLGIGMFALPASILATGFAEEIKRRDFLHTWHMVAKVPFLAGLDAGDIAAITALLKSWAVAPGDVIIRAGDVGDRMYFIVSGLVEADFGGAQPALLDAGDFFGEIALIRNSPRTATVTARSRCQLLVLDVKDFQRFLASSPQIGEIIADAAARRLKEQEELAGHW